MLNINEELSRYQSIDIQSVEEKIGIIPDDIKNAIDLYNKALDDLKSGNEDIAIIALKKAISIYPAFYEAMNLMGLCYLSMGDEGNARRMFNKVIKMDDNSLRASDYLNKMDGKVTDDDSGNNTRAKKYNRVAAETISWIKSGLSPEKNSPYYMKYIVGFLLGVLLLSIVWIIVPSSSPIRIDFSGIFKRSENVSPQIAKLEKEKNELADRLKDANEALRKATENEKKLQTQLEQYAYWSAILRSLQKLEQEGKYREVVLQIERDLSGLDKPDDIEAELKALNDECKPKAVSQFYEMGREIYRSNATAQSVEVYQEAANEYRMAISIIEELDLKPSILTSVYYYGGKAIALSQSPSKEEAEKEALRCFKVVTEVEPNSELASYAWGRIHDIENGRPIKH
ncbi:MAG: tetratricopeptide repeat protein [Clostridiaceae bacterium]|nr:tetratricopeptide repeat protein [Clostridiaceae bacterium]